MKKLLLILLCVSVSGVLGAQEIKKQREIGLVFSDLNSFGLTYKTGTEKSLWRFNTLFFSGYSREDSADSLVNKYNGNNFSVKIGKEYRKGISDKLELRYGADLSFAYAYSKTDNDDKTINNNDLLYETRTYQPGLNLVFGLNYIFGDNFKIGAELLPGFSYLTGSSVQTRGSGNNNDESENDISGFYYGLSNTSALISFTYRF